MTPDQTRRQAAYEAEVLRLWADRADGAHDLAHLRRVWANCQRIARFEGGADAEILMAAAFFHDAVNLPKDSPDRAQASRRSAEAAVAYLSGTDFPASKLPGVAHAIAAHSFSAGIAPKRKRPGSCRMPTVLKRLGPWASRGCSMSRVP
ncbi:HD domain-containing protein [Gemmobacter lanyuensis]